MKFNLFVLPTIPATFEERERLRPIGRNNDKYQAMLTELREIAQLAEELGFDAMSTTEHHFHSEGYEASIAPLMLLHRPCGANRAYQVCLARIGLTHLGPASGRRRDRRYRSSDQRALYCRLCPRISGPVDQCAWPALPCDWRTHGWL